MMLSGLGTAMAASVPASVPVASALMFRIMKDMAITVAVAGLIILLVQITIREWKLWSGHYDSPRS